MRIALVGRQRDRDRIRSLLATDAVDLDIVAEFDSLAAFRASFADADALMLASADADDSAARRARAGAAPPADDDEDAGGDEPLTPREIEVLELLSQGLPNKTIADRLRISDQTVKFHVASICGKLGAMNRTDAVRRAVRRGLVAL